LKVYDKALENEDRSIINRIKRSLSIGKVSGIFFIILFLLDYLVLLFMSTLYPKRSIKREPDFKYENYLKVLNKINEIK
jgi:ABC-type spermidine/putrescine transport system permease subunit I